MLVVLLLTASADPRACCTLTERVLPTRYAASGYGCIWERALLAGVHVCVRLVLLVAAPAMSIWLSSMYPGLGPPCTQIWTWSRVFTCRVSVCALVVHRAVCPLTGAPIGRLSTALWLLATNSLSVTLARVSVWAVWEEKSDLGIHNCVPDN